MLAAKRREKVGRLESLRMPGSLANKGFQDNPGLDTSAEADNSIPAASTIAKNSSPPASGGVSSLQQSPQPLLSVPRGALVSVVRMRGIFRRRRDGSA